MTPVELSAPEMQNEIQRRILELGEWFQNMDLRGVHTAPNHFLGDYPSVKWRRFKHAIPQDLTGKSVLDVGCNAGFYSFEMKRRGARRVVGIDSDTGYLAQAQYAAKINGLDVEFQQMDVYDVASLHEAFDVVLFMGVLYHLRHPLLALDLLYEHTAKDMLVFQTLMRGSNEVEEFADNYPFEETRIFDNPKYPVMHFVEHRYSNDPTNWWIPNRACAEAMLRSSGFEIMDHPEEEVYICRRRSSRD